MPADEWKRPTKRPLPAWRRRLLAPPGGICLKRHNGGCLGSARCVRRESSNAHRVGFGGCLKRIQPPAPSAVDGPSDFVASSTGPEPSWQRKCFRTHEMPTVTKLWSAIIHRHQDKSAAEPLRPPSQAAARIETGMDRSEPPEAGLDNSDHGVAGTPFCRRLSADVGLAADHVESIRALLEVSQAHQQAIPRAVFQNLEMVSKYLRRIQQELDIWQTDERERSVLNSEEALLALPASPRPRPQPLSFECRASPSDR